MRRCATFRWDVHWPFWKGLDRWTCRKSLQRLHDLLDVRPIRGAALLHEVDVIRVFPLRNRNAKAWSRFAAIVPFRHGCPFAEHIDNIQVFEPGEIRRKGD